MYTSTPASEMKTEQMRKFATSDEPIAESQYAFRLISLMFQYPDEEWLQLGELDEAVAEISMQEVQDLLARFLDEIRQASLDELSEMYVRTFDFNSNHSLYLTYSTMGEERERGQILVQLKALYSEAGFEIASAELPDYLPLVLEFASAVPAPLAKDFISQYQAAMQHLAPELAKESTPYTWLMQACLAAVEQFLQD